MTWTKTPPTDVGYYWIRRGDENMEIVSGYGAECWVRENSTGTCTGATLAAEGYEWWPEPIEPPGVVR